MKIKLNPNRQEQGKIGKALLLWLIGIPLPIALLFVFLAGCD